MGAVSVHGVCGALGTVLIALLHENVFLGKDYDMFGQLTTQLTGVVTAFAYPDFVMAPELRGVSESRPARPGAVLGNATHEVFSQ